MGTPETNNNRIYKIKEGEKRESPMNETLIENKIHMTSVNYLTQTKTFQVQYDQDYPFTAPKVSPRTI